MQLPAHGGSTFHLYQAGIYSGGSFSLSSYLYTAQGNQAVDDFRTGSHSNADTGTVSGSASGYQMALQNQGTYSYTASSFYTWTNHESSTFFYSLREEGGSGGLPTIVYEAFGNHSYTRAETYTYSSSGASYSQSHAESYHATGTSSFDQYERGSRSADTWSVNSYAYHEDGHSLETYLSGDTFSTAFADTGASYSQQRHALATSVYENTWGRFEAGTRPTSGLGCIMAFSWESYTESYTSTGSSTAVETVVTHQTWATPPEGGYYIGGGDGGIHLEQVTTDSSHSSHTFFGQGPESSGPSFSFTSYTYFSNDSYSSVTNGTGVAWTNGGLKPGSTTTWTFVDSTTISRVLEQTGEGLEGNYSFTDSGERYHTEQGATNGVSFGPFSSTQTHSHTQDGTFPLIAPQPLALADYAAYVPLDNRHPFLLHSPACDLRSHLHNKGRYYTQSRGSTFWLPCHSLQSQADWQSTKYCLEPLLKGEVPVMLISCHLTIGMVLWQGENCQLLKQLGIRS